jgi:hypothetical protein
VHLHKSFGALRQQRLVLAGLRGIGMINAGPGCGIIHHRSIDAGLDADHLEKRKAPSSDKTSGRNVYSVSCFDVATG